MRARGPALLLSVLASLAGTGPAGAERLRIATYDPDLTRAGPGLLLRDLRAGKDAQIAAVVEVIAAADADVLLLTGIDWDHDGAALAALAERLGAAGAPYPHRFTAQPNSGMPTGLDLDGDGRRGRADDAQGFGFFTGQNGMAVLSRFPLGPVTDYSATLWRDLPGSQMPDLPPEVAAVQRLPSVAHWDVPVTVGGQTLHLLAMAATPPVFDGPEDRNGRRNHDELAFWLHHLPEAPFVVMGDLAIDPVDGEGRREALTALQAKVTDPLPRSAGGAAAADPGQHGDPALDTTDWPLTGEAVVPAPAAPAEDGEDEAEAEAAPPPATGPGNLRVDYVLPDRRLTVHDAGVLWPAPGESLAEAVSAASPHRLVWVEVELL